MWIRPREDLDRFKVTRRDLVAAAARGAASAPVRALIEYEVRRARAHYAAAAPGVELIGLAVAARCLVAERRSYLR
jgi:phytoene synthase